MMSVQVGLYHHSFAVQRLPEPWNWMCHISHCFHGSSQLCPPILVVSIGQASSASAGTSPFAAVPFWRLCPSPSRVGHLRSTCPAVRLQLTLSPQRFFPLHNPRSICISLDCLGSAFLVVSWPQASFWMSSCAMPQGFGPFLLRSRLCLHSLDDLVVRTASSTSVFPHRKWLKVLFWSIYHCSLCWLCCWARCGMLQDMDNIEASCVFYVKVGAFNHLEQSKFCLLTVNKMGIVRLTIKHDMSFSVSSL